MSTETPDPRLDRLYRLLPAIYRMRDAEQKYPLQALLRVIDEQVKVVEDDIAQLYENWFIETAEDWAVSYIADLIGYRPALEAGAPGDGQTDLGRELNRVLVPRREVANTIRYRRRKGTLALLELLANDVAGWPARAVEFFKLLDWNQNINHLRLERARTADLRRVEELDLIDGPFDQLAHTVDVRRINSHRTIGRFNIPSVGVFIWRLKPYSFTQSTPYCVENSGPHCFTFSVLGQDAPLFIKPEPEIAPAQIAGEMNVPAPIRRLAFDKHKELFYGVDKSLVIWAEGWAGYDPAQPIPAAAIIPADLSGWGYAPPLKRIAVDPILGRFAFPPSQLPKKGARVTYHYAFSDDLGGGEYARSIFDPAARQIEATDPNDEAKKVDQLVEPKFYRVGKGQSFHSINEALEKWAADEPMDAVIELMDSSVYVEQINLELKAERTLQLRAANRKRPVIRLIDWLTDSPDALSITMREGSRFSLDGLLITGRAVHINGATIDDAGKKNSGQTVEKEAEKTAGKSDGKAGDQAGNHYDEEPSDPRAQVCASELVIRHCTLVPGWGLENDCEPRRPAEPSLELYNIRAKVRIEHSILGSIQIHQDEVKVDPVPLRITDSIIDATEPDKDAIGAPGDAPAHAVLTILRSTLFGVVAVHAVELGENSIFMDCVNVARRQLGCLRFCYVSPGCRTPRRYRCQPDLVEQAVKEKIADPALQAALIKAEQLRVRPQFTSIRFGHPGYAQLAATCAEEIKRGADDESEMGVFHDLYQPQRYANLVARLEEFTPAGLDVGIHFST